MKIDKKKIFSFLENVGYGFVLLLFIIRGEPLKFSHEKCEIFV